MSVVSVVVPVYNVAPYLRECLDSIAQQTKPELEVVLVDDGSTDESPAIAREYVERDPRFRLVSQANAGLGAARNTGAALATGDFLAFVDSDDIVPRYAYDLMAGTLERTGSDFVSGNALRFTSRGASQAPFLARVCERTLHGTHITRFPRLISDRTAWNKLYRRDFWARHGFRFPEGVLYEDIPVTLPAHYLARSVDVLEEVVYLWRRREGDDLSITQRRTEPKALRDRIAAVDSVLRFLAERRLPASKLLYEYSVLMTDLRIFLDVLPTADEDFRSLFIELANDLLDRADPRAFELGRPLAIDRLKWHLVRRRALPEVLEVLRFQDEELESRPPVRAGRKWYGDYPYLDDERLRIPRRVFELDAELAPVCRIEDLRWEGGALVVEGYAYIDLVGAPTAESQTVELRVRAAGGRRVVARVRAVPVHRPDVTATSAQEIADLDWTGFSARIDPAAFAAREGAWEVEAVIRAEGVVRRTTWFPSPSLRAAPVGRTTFADGRVGEARVGPDADFAITVGRERALVHALVADGSALELEGELAPGVPETPRLHARRRGGGTRLTYPVFVDGDGGGARRFLARVSLADVVKEVDVGDRASHAEERAEGLVWDLSVGRGARRDPLVASAALPKTALAVHGREVVVEPDRDGRLILSERSFRPVVDGAEWRPDGTLVLNGSFRGPEGEYELLLRERWRRTGRVFPFRHDAGAGRFTLEVTPASASSPAGDRPLGEGLWDFSLRRLDVDEPTAPFLVAPAFLGSLPLASEAPGKPCRLGSARDEFPVLAVERALAPEERGGFRQRRLRASFGSETRAGGLLDAVVYDCFGGTEYSDSPRAIHEELVRRGAPLRHLWVAHDDTVAVPETATAIRAGSREYYDAYGRARYLVANDYWPSWFVSRPGQTTIQTWHGMPLKVQGRLLEAWPKAVREYRRVLRERRENWQYVVSPGPAASELLADGFPAGEILETGLPRTDRLLAADRDERAADVKRRLGVEGRRLVLYAPTYRDYLDHALGLGRRLGQLRDLPTYRAEAIHHDGYRLGTLLDLAAVADALPDAAVCFRKHPRVFDRVPPRVLRRALDVSEYPDEGELLLAADVLVTDYSSAVFDFAALGRPILFYVPDLELYRDEVRGLAIDLEAEAPGPLLRTTDDVIAALRDPDGVRSAHADSYAAFAHRYCGLADGRAAARVVERVFSS